MLLLCGGCREKSALVHGLQVIVSLFWTVDVFSVAVCLASLETSKGGNYQ
jgi:hypothetical protein